MNVYVASSWRNPRQPEVVQTLREHGHEVYDFRNPKPGDNGFRWSEIDPDWQQWSPAEFQDALNHPLATDGFQADMDALSKCHALVAVQPFGVSASIELGWAAGAGKHTFVLLDRGEPELMLKMCDYICCSIEHVLYELEQLGAGDRWHVCPE